MIETISQILKTHEPITLGVAHESRQRAAVLMPLIRDQETRVLMTERAGSLSTHGGEIAFPGGQADPDDPDLVFTALRENYEELGVPASEVEVVGALRPFISKFGLHLTPVVGLLEPGITILPNDDEIASVFEVPLSFFQTAVPTRVDDLTRHGERQLVPAFEYDGYDIWGLTSMIITEFLSVTGLRPVVK